MFLFCFVFLVIFLYWDLVDVSFSVKAARRVWIHAIMSLPCATRQNSTILYVIKMGCRIPLLFLKSCDLIGLLVRGTEAVICGWIVAKHEIKISKTCSLLETSRHHFYWGFVGEEITWTWKHRDGSFTQQILHTLWWLLWSEMVRIWVFSLRSSLFSPTS